jgi:hypothetical protein
MDEIAAKKGQFTLFALLKRANTVMDHWDLFVSAPWLVARNLKAGRAFAQLFIKAAGKELLYELARVAIREDGDAEVRFILKNFPVDDGELRVPGFNLPGLEIEDAIIFRAKKPRASVVGLRNGVAHTASQSARHA